MRPITLLTLIAVIGCGPSQESLKSYYYPTDLPDGLVYQYLSSMNDTPQESYYWFFKPHIIDEQEHFTGQYYDAHGTVQQFFRQSADSGGFEMEAYTLYEGEPLDPTAVEIIHDDVFPFYPRDTMSVYVYKVRYTSQLDSSITTITRNRRYTGHVEWLFNGKSYDAIQFKLQERIENDKNGVITIDFRGHEIYAEGIGLVRSIRSSDEGNIKIVDELTDRLEMKKFETMFQ